jgi:hypothetical protein
VEISAWPPGDVCQDPGTHQHLGPAAAEIGDSIRTSTIGIKTMIARTTVFLAPTSAPEEIYAPGVI